MKLHFVSWNFTEKNHQQGIERITFLHGLAGTGKLWRPIAASLEKDFAIMALDQRGHGESRTIPNDEPGYSPLEFGRDVIETLQAEDFSPSWIVGHSMGVRSACAAAHLNPQVVKGLILIDLGLSGPAGGGLNQNLSSFLSILPSSFTSREDARVFMANSPDPAIGQYLLAASDMSPNGEITFPFDRKGLLEVLKNAHGVDLRPWIREYAEKGNPVLILRGEKSKVWTHDEFITEKNRFDPLKSVQFMEIPATGHGLPYEKRAEFIEVLRLFIGK
ncbi:MAG TPA: hypothetical protein DCS07_07000 [Bdellovibrionales bacterium]|nr:MAG: hypothetical protein A2Z97_04510 [Bdellovibrionales bacterium GWB1_52_6]OFZ06324.1 MAG: hypothetical protein A2X97_02570 [Bdellovibrionales bacterium GWA1_52_35]OFZ39727.1 MAG: hypothetical protein A2070_12775 [Bdellovibrionales bacterium GWC1_52_8]HAR42366.1 hypothetical protein [Bdellovibrionales bacterium]HCM40075.1 hypothetical protein [Bdellovibrionales bacterium]